MERKDNGRKKGKTVEPKGDDKIVNYILEFKDSLKFLTQSLKTLVDNLIE